MITVAVGTDKGAYLLRSHDRRVWRTDGPVLTDWAVTALARAPDGSYLAGVEGWMGAGLQRSPDLLEWRPVEPGPVWPEGSGRSVDQIWTLHASDGVLLAGLSDAGLFRSDDSGASWQPVPGLDAHPDRETWMGGGAGLCTHRILTAGERLWVGISAVGVLRSEDGGASFARRDDGVASPLPPDAGDGDGGPGGCCVHGLVADPADPDRIWRQDHTGVYRTTDGGDHWERIEEGLPAGFGFPVVRDHATGRLFVVPLEDAGNRVPVRGRFRVHHSDDDGDTWRASGTGWPEEPTYTVVLRGAIDADQLDPGGLYLGTTTGDVWASADVGESWQRLPGTYPRVLTVAAFPGR